MTPAEESKLKARIDARKEAEAMIELIAEATVRIGREDETAARTFLQTIDATVHAALQPKPVQSKPATTTTTLTPEKPLPLDVAEAMAIIDEMEHLADDIPDAGQDFAAEVLEKARSIGRTIERSKSVTGPQMEALENMCSGLARWIRD